MNNGKDSLLRIIHEGLRKKGKTISCKTTSSKTSWKKQQQQQQQQQTDPLAD